MHVHFDTLTAMIFFSLPFFHAKKSLEMMLDRETEKVSVCYAMSKIPHVW
jgi:hypothetical protein